MNKLFEPSLKVISGGQTGADRGGLDAAIELGIAHGGWAPKGNIAEDGTVPTWYKLKEATVAGYPHRTKLNVKEADCTLIFTYGPPKGGSLLTAKYASGFSRTYMCFDLYKLDDEIVAFIGQMFRHRMPKVINVAGSRESKAPGIQAHVKGIMLAALEPFK